MVIIRPLAESDFAAFKKLRLTALHDHPEAFGSAYEDWIDADDKKWSPRLRDGVSGERGKTFVAEEAGELVGNAGVFRDEGMKVCHSATLWGVYVSPNRRGSRIAERLVQANLDWCRNLGLRIVKLSATTTNAAAIRCYQRCGFAVYGIDPQVIRVGDQYFDEVLMWRRV